MRAFARVMAERAGWTVAGAFDDEREAIAAARGADALVLLLDARCLLDPQRGAPSSFGGLESGTSFRVHAARPTGELASGRPAGLIAADGASLAQAAEGRRPAGMAIGTWCAGLEVLPTPPLATGAQRLTAWMPIKGASGYGVGSRNLALGMRRAGVDVAVPYFWNDEPSFELPPDESALIQSMHKPARKHDPAIIYRPATAIQNSGPYFDAYRSTVIGGPMIGYTMFETDDIPARWYGALERCEAVWVPSTGGKEIFVRAGIRESRVSVVPIGIDVGRYDPDGPAYTLGATRKTVFLSVFEWSQRKAPDVLLAAWARAFGPDDDVVLYLRTGSQNVDATARVAETLARLDIDVRRCAPIVVISPVSEADWAGLYRSADAFVLPSRGEGFCIPYLEAMAAGVPLIGTSFGGSSDLLDDATGFPIAARFGPTDADLCARIPLYRGQRWLEPDVDATAAAMRSVVRAPGDATERAAQALLRAHRTFDRDVVGALAARKLAEVPARSPGSSRARFTVLGPATAGGGAGEATRSLLRVAEAAGAAVAMPAARMNVEVTLDAYDEDRIAGAHDHEPASTVVQVGLGPGATHAIRYVYEIPTKDEELRVLESATSVWVTSDEHLRAFNQAGVPAERLRVVPLAIDVHRSGPDSPRYSSDANITRFLIPVELASTVWEDAVSAFYDALAGTPSIELTLMLLDPPSAERDAQFNERLMRRIAGRTIRLAPTAYNVPPDELQATAVFNTYDAVVACPGIGWLRSALLDSLGVARIGPDAESFKLIVSDPDLRRRLGRERRRLAITHAGAEAAAPDLLDALDERASVDNRAISSTEELLIVVVGADEVLGRRTAAFALANAHLNASVRIARELDAGIVTSARQRYIARIPAGLWVGDAWDRSLIAELRPRFDIDAVAAVHCDNPMFGADISRQMRDHAQRLRVAYFVLLQADLPVGEILENAPRDTVVIARSERWRRDPKRTYVVPRVVVGPDDPDAPLPDDVDLDAITGAIAPVEPATKMSAPSRTRLLWRGDFLPNHSIAVVNRKLAQAMVALDTLEIIPQGEPVPQVEETLGLIPCRLEDLAPADHLVTIKHQWPPQYLRPKSGYSVHIQPYEYGAIPNKWLEQTLRLADDVWCYTNYVRNLYIEAGLPESRAHVVPLGFDPAVFHPGVAPYDIGSESRFIFLFVGGTIWRKGIDILLDAYLSAFTPADDVALIVKSFGNTSFYANQNESQRIAELASRTDIAMIRHTDGNMSDPGMAALYRRANALVLPYRGEGFGLPVLEAMACGTPAIVSAGGATDDFVNDAIGYRIPAERLDHGTFFAGEEHRLPGWTLEVAPAVLAKYMRYAFENRAELKTRGEQAARFVHDRFTWAHAAQKAVARVDVLLEREPISRAGDYETFTAYGARLFSPHDEDGMLMELFARLRVTSPYFVEFCGGAGAACTSIVLARAFGWPGLLIESDVTHYAALGQTAATLPNARTLQANIVTGRDVATVLAENGVSTGFDLFALSAGTAAVILPAVTTAYRPRVMVLRQEPGDLGLTAIVAEIRTSYAFLGLDASGSSAFFVRRDLHQLTDFPELAAE
jgi:glycosyltransferase involved in cell wall biosynthesis